jgi:Family of unknown function (DUF6166)
MNPTQQTKASYMGHIDATRNREVIVCRADGENYQLAPRFDLRNHSPTGFAWGYGGSGPAQLALAILADYFGHDSWPGRSVVGDLLACTFYQDFKNRVIARLPVDKMFELIDSTIAIAIETSLRAHPGGLDAIGQLIGMEAFDAYLAEAGKEGETVEPFTAIDRLKEIEGEFRSTAEELLGVKLP